MFGNSKDDKMKFYFLKIVITLLISINFAQASITICSWNLCNFGKSKSESEIEYIANTLKSYDIIAIQEVVAGEGGADAVARLSDALNRKGTKWDYTISDPTTNSTYTINIRYQGLIAT